MNLNKSEALNMLTTHVPSSVNESSVHIEYSATSINMQVSVTKGNLVMDISCSASVTPYLNDYYLVSGYANSTSVRYNNLDIAYFPDFILGLKSLSFISLSEELERDFNSVTMDVSPYIKYLDFDHLYKGNKTNFNKLSLEEQKLQDLKHYVNITPITSYPCNPLGYFETEVDKATILKVINGLTTN